MILASPKDRPELTPSDQLTRPEDDRIVYVFRVPSVIDRARFEREIIIAGGRRAGVFETLACLRSAVIALTDEDDPTRVSALAKLDAHRVAVTAQIERIQAETADDRRSAEIARFGELLEDPEIAALVDGLRDSWEPLRRLEADAAVYPLIRAQVAARLFLVDWLGRKDKPARDGRGLKDSAIAAIPASHLGEISAFVDGLFGPTETERGNSASPHGGASDRTPSPAAS